MNEDSYSFGLYLGEFLDKAAVAMSEIATAAEDFLNKTIEISKDFQHPADAKRIEFLENLPKGTNSENAPPSPSRHRKKSITPSNKKSNNAVKKVSKTTEKENEAEESSESTDEILATQKEGKAAGFSTNHYLITMAEADDDEEDEEEEESDSDSYSSSYSNV